MVARFQDNIDRFAFITCEYNYTKAKALTAADAFVGKFMPRQAGEYLFPNTAQVRMVKDGKNIRYEVIADEESRKIQREGYKSLTPDPKNPGLASGPLYAFGSSSELYNGTDSLSFVPSDGNPASGNNVNFRGSGIPSWSQEKQQGGLLLNVICGGGANGLPRLAAATQKPIEIRSAPHRGVDCQWLTIHTPNGEKMEFALDPARGHLPRCIIWTYEKDKEYRYEVTEIKECSKGRWFPMRIVTYMTQNRGFWIASEYKVTHLDVDNRPSRESLMLDLPAGTSVMDVENPSMDKAPPTIILKQNERIHPDEIPMLRDLIARKQQQPLADTALRPPGIPWWKWTIGGIGLALVLIATVRRIRSRRAAIGAA